jgi:hypothetical protein
MIKKINLIKVESSNIDKVGYDENTLYVLFKNGGFYRYKNVEIEKYDKFLIAESQGKFLNTEIKKGGYEFERIWDDDPFYIENVESEDNKNEKNI